jgi:uncharacterized membrane protein
MARWKDISTNVWLLVIVAAGTLLRLINLGGRPLWYDEAFAILYAGRSLGEILYGTLARVQGAAADVHPVLYYFSLHGWMSVWGQGVFAVRMLSVLLGIGTVIAAWGLARELFGDRVALTAAAFVAGSPFLIAYSQEARMYASLGFWSAASLWAFARAARTGGWGVWIAMTLCGALALYSHNLGFLTFAALGVFVVVRAMISRPAERRGHWTLAARTALAGLAMAILFSPWLAVAPSQLGKIEQAYWVTRPDLRTLLQTLIVFHFDFENAKISPGLVAPLLFGAVLMLSIVIIQAARRLTGEDERQQSGVWLLATLALLPVAALFLISQWRPVYIIRGLLPAGVFYVILAAWATTRMPRIARYGLLVILAGLVGVTLVNYYGYQDFPRGPFLQLDAMLREQMRPGDVIVHSNKLTFFPAHVYDRTLPQVFLGDPPGSGSDTLARPTQEALGLFPTDLDSATADKSRVWLIIFRQAITEAKGSHPHVAWLSDRFTQTETTSLGDMDVMLFVAKGR